MKFNEKLKALREAKGLTQDEIASRLNVSRQSVSKWELGINEPDFKTAKELCKILDCSIAELIDDENEVVSTAEEKRERRTRLVFIINIAVMIMSMMMVFALVAISENTIIIHWNRNGSISYGSRWYLLVGLVSALLGLVMAIVLRYTGKRIEQYKKYKLPLQIVALVFSVILIATLFVVSSFMIKDFIRGDAFLMNLLPTSIFTLMVGISPFMHPFFNKRNTMFGFRTYYTLSNDKVWNKVNAFSSYSVTLFCAIGYSLSLIFINQTFTIYFTALLVVGVIPPFIYHEIIRKKDNEQS